jgi:hypothetical protein
MPPHPVHCLDLLYNEKEVSQLHKEIKKFIITLGFWHVDQVLHDVCPGEPVGFLEQVDLGTEDLCQFLVDQVNLR